MSTKSNLLTTVQKNLKKHRFIIASNREPYTNKYRGNNIDFVRTVSGLTIALDPVMQAVGGIWVAWGSGDADKSVVDESSCVKVPPANPRYTLRRIWLSEEEQNGYYYGYANQALWPLCHIAYEKPLFLKGHWQIYEEINRRFAEAILEEIKDEKVFIWLQDYHLTLAAKFIKEKRPDTIVAMFWHIPWPNPEVFRICPQKKEILEGLLSCDLLGFHIRYHCINFMNTVDFELESKVNNEENSIMYQGHKTLIRDFPISVDFKGMAKEAQSSEVIRLIKELPQEISPAYEILALSIDRIDYTKGMLERLKAIDLFLEKYPEFRKKIVFYQVGAPSRIGVDSYKKLISEAREAVKRINEKYEENNWYPVVLNEECIDYARQLALYRCADMCIVSSLHDGMNLVAKEYVAANVDNKGVLILSQFTGAARELANGAILINPFDFDSVADAIKEAIHMSREKRKENMRALREVLAKKNIYLWAERFISSLEDLKSGIKTKTVV